MIVILFLYILPIIINLIGFNSIYNELKKMDDYGAFVTYITICFVPAINLLVTIYLICTYVLKAFGEN